MTKGALFVPLILFGLSRVGASALRRVQNNEDAYFVLMLGMMAVAGVLAAYVNLPGIVGAFLAGLAVNAAVREHPAKAKLEFLGKALFIPAFFIATGFLIDPLAFARSVADDFPLVAGIVGTLALGKWIAAALAGRAFGYTPGESPAHCRLTPRTLEPNVPEADGRALAPGLEPRSSILARRR